MRTEACGELETWKINYGLDKRTPEDAGRWWHEKNNGMAPAGAVAALGLCINEIERLTKEMHDLKVSTGIRAVASEAMLSLARVATGIENNEITKLKAEVERLRSLCGEWLDFTENVFPSCAAGWDQLTGLRRRTSEVIGRGEGER